MVGHIRTNFHTPLDYQTIYTHSVPIRLGRFPTAEVAQSPCSVAKHAQLPAIADEVQQRTESTGTENKVTALGAVTRNVTQRPNGLFPHIGLVAAQKLDKNRHSTSFNYNLGLLGRSGGNVGQCPGSLKLDQCVRRSKEFHKTAHDTGFDNTLDRGVPLLGQQLPELGRALDLRLNLVGENTLNHLREFHIELKEYMSVITSTISLYY